MKSLVLKWIVALTILIPNAALRAATPSSKGKPIQKLVVEGTTYSEVVLTSFDGATVGVEHEAGVARISAAKLKPEQIAALNTTTTSVRIDPGKITAPATTPVATPLSKAPASPPIDTAVPAPEPRPEKQPQPKPDPTLPVSNKIPVDRAVQYLESQHYRLRVTTGNRSVYLTHVGQMVVITAKDGQVSIVESAVQFAPSKDRPANNYDVVRQIGGQILLEDQSTLAIAMIDPDPELLKKMNDGLQRARQSTSLSYSEIIPHPIWQIEVMRDRNEGIVGFTAKPK